MIKKRYLMILSIAIVSVLLGSLWYNNLVLAGKPELQPSIYKDAVEITVLDWTAREYYDLSIAGTYDIGLHFDKGFTVDFPFIFTPKGSLLNITRLWISVVVTSKSGHGLTDFKAKFNNNNFTISFDRIEVDKEWLGSHTRHLEYNPVLNVIGSGVNLLQLYGVTDYDLHIYRINIFIEYEYQA